MITKALKERQNVRWKVCANCNYRFFISECGGAMQERACPECGTQIGGMSHHDTSGTKDLVDLGKNKLFVQTTIEDNSQPGYCLRNPSEENDKVVRVCNPAYFSATN
jgi:hypothetical protein